MKKKLDLLKVLKTHTFETFTKQYWDHSGDDNFYNFWFKSFKALEVQMSVCLCVCLCVTLATTVIKL